MCHSSFKFIGWREKKKKIKISIYENLRFKLNEMYV